MPGPRTAAPTPDHRHVPGATPPPTEQVNHSVTVLPIRHTQRPGVHQRDTETSSELSQYGSDLVADRHPCFGPGSGSLTRSADRQRHEHPERSCCQAEGGPESSLKCATGARQLAEAELSDLRSSRRTGPRRPADRALDRGPPFRLSGPALLALLINLTKRPSGLASRPVGAAVGLSEATGRDRPTRGAASGRPRTFRRSQPLQRARR